VPRLWLESGFLRERNVKAAPPQSQNLPRKTEHGTFNLSVSRDGDFVDNSYNKTI
jgi:hypothetical protein